jgi:hypothetical protein
MLPAWSARSRLAQERCREFVDWNSRSWWQTGQPHQTLPLFAVRADSGAVKFYRCDVRSLMAEHFAQQLFSGIRDESRNSNRASSGITAPQ